MSQPVFHNYGIHVYGPVLSMDRRSDSTGVWASLITMFHNKHTSSMAVVASPNARPRWLFELSVSDCLCLLSVSSLMFLTLGCATTHATLAFTAPSTATSGVSFTVTVDVLYQGKADAVINSRIHFTSSDPAAVLPADYYFTPADAGSHTWPNGFVLKTAGNQTISGEIVQATGINGSATITVSQ